MIQNEESDIRYQKPLHDPKLLQIAYTKGYLICTNWETYDPLVGASHNPPRHVNEISKKMVRKEDGSREMKPRGLISHKFEDEYTSKPSKLSKGENQKKPVIFVSAEKGPRGRERTASRHVKRSWIPVRAS